MSLRIPSNDPSLSPSPHRHMSQFRQHSTSPSPSSSPLKGRLGKHSQLDATEDGFSMNTHQSGRHNRPPQRELEQEGQQTPQPQTINDESMEAANNTDHLMTDSPPSISTPPFGTSTPSISNQHGQHEQSFSRHFRPLSTPFTHNNPSSSKRLATSFLHSNAPSNSNNILAAGTMFPRPKAFEPTDAPPRGLRRSTGLLNLDEASLGSAITRKPSYRSRKSHIKSSSSSSTCSSYSTSSGHSSSSSIHSDFSRASTPPPMNPFLGRIPSAPSSVFNMESPAHGAPLKRPHPFGLFNETTSQKPHFPQPKWTFNSDSKPKWQFSSDSTKPKWQFSHDSRPSSQAAPTASPFFQQPFFSPSESSPSPFIPPQNIRKLPHASTTSLLSSSPSPSQPILKIRKMNSMDSLHHSTPSSSSPKFTNTQPYSTHPTHPLAFSFATSPSPSPGPRDEDYKGRPATPVFSFNLSRNRASPAPSSSSSTSTSTVDANETSKPVFTLPKQPFKINASLEADLSIGSSVSNPEYHTPENYKFVKPLQTAFLSTGLLSKRNRRKHFSEARMAPPDTPCKKPTGPMTPGPMQLSNSKNLFGNTFSFSPRSLPTNFNGSSSNNNAAGPFSRNRFSMDFGHFSDSLFNEPSTPTKRDQSFGDESSSNIYSAMPMNIPVRATKQVSNASTITPATYLSTTPTSSNSSSTSINRYSSTPQSQASRWMDGSPSEHSSPRTPEISMHSDVPQLSLDPGAYPKNSVVRCDDDDNHEMEDSSSVIEAPKTPAKTPKGPHEIVIPSTIMSLEKMGPDNVSDVVLRERYSDVQMIGTGEFSIVYAVSEKSSVVGIETARYAVKRTKTPFVGYKARSRRNEEVEILRNLTYSSKHDNDDDGKEYIVNLIDAWELKGHLYIVTEYCENGNLDTFLSERGNVSRLDEWRVWKVLVEITLVSLFFSISSFYLLTFCCFRVYDSFIPRGMFILI